MARHGAVEVGAVEPVLVVDGLRYGGQDGTYELENIGGQATVFLGNQDVTVSGARRGWTLAPGARARFHLTSPLWAISDGGTEVAFFRPED